MKWPRWRRTPKPPPRAAVVVPDTWPQRWPNRTGPTADVTEDDALGLSGLYRAVSLIAGQLASLDLQTVRETGPDTTEPVPSVFDDPDSGDGQTVYEWKETGFIHLVLHGKCGALKLRNQGGGLYRLPWVHPLQFREEWPTAEDYQQGTLPAGGLWFHVTLQTGRTVKLDANDFFYVPGLSLDGRTGTSMVEKARGSLGTAIAGDRAAANLFAKGALIAGIVTPEEELDSPGELEDLREQLDNATSGYDNAGKVAAFNKRLTFTPWTMSANDAQFLQSRQFQIEEISRWTGVPPHLLMQTEKQTSWGTGVEMQDRALGRSVLGPWARRFEERASRLLANPRRVQFDFTKLERPAPDAHQKMILELLSAGLISKEEARARLGWGPLPAELAVDPALEEADPSEDRVLEESADV